MSGAPGASIPLASVPNLRDVGGWVGADGRRVRAGLLFRCTALDRLTDDDAQALTARGIRTVVDFRTETERESRPDRALDGADALVLDVLADSTDLAPARMGEFLYDPRAAARFLAGDEPREVMHNAYRDLVRLPSARAGFGRFFRDLLDEDIVPVVYHCTTGKDRTGWATAALLTLLGVDEDQVYAEYLLTNEQLLPALAPLFDRFAALGATREQLVPLLGVERDYLDTAFEQVRTGYGTIENYFADGLGIAPADQERLRDRYLELIAPASAG